MLDAKAWYARLQSGKPEPKQYSPSEFRETQNWMAAEAARHGLKV